EWIGGCTRRRVFGTDSVWSAYPRCDLGRSKEEIMKRALVRGWGRELLGSVSDLLGHLLLAFRDRVQSGRNPDEVSRRILGVKDVQGSIVTGNAEGFSDAVGHKVR